MDRTQKAKSLGITEASYLTQHQMEGSFAFIRSGFDGPPNIKSSLAHLNILPSSLSESDSHVRSHGVSAGCCLYHSKPRAKSGMGLGVPGTVQEHSRARFLTRRHGSVGKGSNELETALRASFSLKHSP